ncbi:hypothetical protein [Saliniramus sp.]|uniref:hypothetical protein n=1 Tax=Saliniramus sp. TaxID=2986772 RepID=UPI002BFFCC41|nr:hypothetical protein [Saliniramus sp.]HMB11936.1 hypothetical protein [Saliniramus sp.]
MAELTARPEGRAARTARMVAWFIAAGALIAVFFMLAGCTPRIDEAQARLCRMTLPALNPDGADIRITRLLPARDGSGIRIDYSVTPSAAIASRSRPGPARAWVICRFDPVPFSRIEPRLAAIETHNGFVSGASVYLMQRFWLRTPEAAAADPGR